MKGSHKGFSLIELMMVVSIISLMTAFAMPSYIRFQIAASRAEMYQNSRSVLSLLEAYRADHEKYPTPGGGIAGAYFMSSPMSDGSTYSVTSSYCGISGSGQVFGFYVPECEKLRYVYELDTSGATFHGLRCAGTNGNSCFVLRMQSYHSSSGGTISDAGRPITKKCKAPSGYDSFYYDTWLYNEQGQMTPYSATSDALKNCF